MLKLKKALALVTHPRMFNKDYKKTILLSHMRSRSSVLSHILGSNVEIAGYYEQHLKHTDPLFDLKIKANLIMDECLSIDATYLYDKVLHDRFDPRFFESYKIIVLVRKPEPTLKSIMSMGGITNSLWKNDPYRAFAYYCQRLQNIMDIVGRVDRGVCFIEADKLIDDTEEELNRITAFLDLNDPLTSSYNSFNKTGKAVFGDPSENIKSGSIVRTEEKSSIVIPENLLVIANQYYERCVGVCSEKSRI